MGLGLRPKGFRFWRLWGLGLGGLGVLGFMKHNPLRLVIACCWGGGEGICAEGFKSWGIWVESQGTGLRVLGIPGQVRGMASA